VPDGIDLILADHQVVATAFDEFEATLDPTVVGRIIDQLMAQEGTPLVEAVATLRALVEAHVADEEQRLLPALRSAATDRQLDELGGRILQAKQRVG
jgi:hypothetical protein